MKNNTAFFINKKDIIRNFSRAVLTYDQTAVLQQEIGQRLLERLDCIDEQSDIQNILDLGGGTGYFIPQIYNRFKNANIFNIDLTYNFLLMSKDKIQINYSNTNTYFICGDAENIPLKTNSVDFIFSNCVFHWCYDLATLFKEINRILKPNGILLFSLFGQDTLKELKMAFSNIDNHQHVNPFLDMHYFGDILVSNRFKETVVDMEILTMTYNNIKDLLQDIKNWGENAKSQLIEMHTKNELTIEIETNSKIKNLFTKNRMKKLEKEYEVFRNKDKLPATFEVIYGFARK